METTRSRLGQGTWYLGENASRHDSELDALRTGIDVGLTTIDTAEMYGDGASEILVGEAIAGRRDDVYLISKVLPSNADRRRMRESCRASLRRLGTDHLDLYLLHWRGRHPLRETVEGFEDLVREGLIRSWGVSNFDTEDMDELVAVPGGDQVATDQVLYNLETRGPEVDLLPWCRETGIPLMSYSPIGHGSLLRTPFLASLAEVKGLTAAQIAIAWVLRHPDLLAAAKASTREHVLENRAAMDVTFTPLELAGLDRLFPRPPRKVPLEVL
ncbi:aldo/keto reductase [Leifsonia sp. LS-T14]|uniref:aldo/keto reductase n=1 Tax=unclassified Leifsonia TaxID=2663824 RepID=UPI0035A6FD3D